MREKETNYFHSLEKRHYNSKTIRNLVTDDGTRISTDVEILQEAKNFYESLYTSITDKELSNEYDDIFFPENIEAKLTDDQKLSCEGELSAAQCFECLKTMEMGKSPGTDGLPAEFYQVFLERRVNAFTCISEFIFLQRSSLHFTTKGFNNLDSEEKQTSAVPKKLETYKSIEL